MIIELITTASVTAAATSWVWFASLSKMKINGRKQLREDTKLIRGLNADLIDLIHKNQSLRIEIEALRPDAEKWRAKKGRDRAYDVRRRAKPKLLNWEKAYWECELDQPDDRLRYPLTNKCPKVVAPKQAENA